MSTTQKPAFTGASERWLFAVIAVVTSCVLLSASSLAGTTIAHNTPSYVSTAKNLGAAEPSKTIEVSVWLNVHNRSGLDAMAESLYDRTSPNYRHWLTRADRAAFMPTAAEAKTVQTFFESNHLKVVRVGPDNLFVRAKGTVSDVEKAFHVQLNKYKLRGKVIRANDRDPSIDGAAGPLAAAVYGLDSGEFYHPLIERPGSGQKGKKAAAVAAPQTNVFSNTCFPGTETDVFSNNANGSLPVATYTGNFLNMQTWTTNGCALEPPDVQTAYNLTGLYNEGYNGAGQTIGIVDWCGSQSIQSDANGFSAQYGLPALTSSNFAITYIPSPSLCESEDAEINIDVEWSHAVAPGANINLIVPPSASFADIDDAVYTSITYGLANVISGSYGAPESEVDESILQTENLISELGAASGVSTNFSSGDYGDFTAFGLSPTVSTPADSPWATAVGGVSVALNADNSIAWQAGWGTDETLLAEDGFVSDPPGEEAFGFAYGSGGGETNCASQIDDPTTGEITCLAGYPKPSYQKKIAGKYRQLPDISWIGDPFTGVAILISVPFQVPEQVWQVYGGTSVACPMFSALWAIANQEAEASGNPALGLAAEYVYSMPAGTITDVVPVASKTNVAGSVQDSSGTTAYNADSIMGGAAPAKFISAIWDYAWVQDTAYVISFGTDCTTGPTYGFLTACNASNSLQTKKGWDNVTGVGTPVGQAFADSFFGK